MGKYNPLTELENNETALEEILNRQVNDYCVPCRENILIKNLTGPRKIEIENNSNLTKLYKVTEVNRWFYTLSQLNGSVNWKLVNDFTGTENIIAKSNYKIYISYTANDNGVLYKIYPYIKLPIEEVCQSTWIKKSYRRLIGAAVDNGNETVSSIFSYFCRFYVNRYEKYALYDDWRSTYNIDNMLEAIIDFLYEDKSRLDTLDFARKQKVVNHFDVGKSSLKNAGEFDNQWDKLLHFMAGIKLSDTIGDWFGYEVGFWNEKVDSIKRAWGEITGTKQTHQVGFDWKDFAWTAAGSHFYKLVANTPTHTQGIKIIKAFANKQLAISSIFNADSIPAGHSYFNQRISPFFETNIDLVDKELKAMRRKIEAFY